MNARRAKPFAALAGGLGLVVVLALVLPGLRACDATRELDLSARATRDASSLAAGLGETERSAEAAAPSGAFYSAPVGREFVFEIDGYSTAEIEFATGSQIARESLARSHAGRLRIGVVARATDELVLACDFPSLVVDVVSGGQTERDEPLEKAAQNTCLVRMRDDGRLLGFRFDPAVAPAARNWVRSVIAAFHFEVDASGARAWERDETDPTGTARVRYVARAEPGADELALDKTKLACVIAGVGDDARSELDSRSTGVLSRSLASVKSAHFEERLVVVVAHLDVTTRVVHGGKLALVESGWRTGTLAAFDWNAAWSSVSGAEDMEAIGESGEQRLRARMLEGVTLTALLSEIEALANAEPRDTAALMDARHTLAELLRDQPAAVSELARLVPTLSDAVADVVLGAAGAAGTAPAQGLLAGVLGDKLLSSRVHQSALDALFQLTQPIPASYAAVANVLADPSVDPRVRANGMLTFGALSSMDPAADAGASTHVAQLIALERQAREENKLEHWLRALGNASSPQVFAAVRPYLDSPDPALRTAAVDALRGVGDAECVGALSRRALSDADANVRRTCASVLADRTDADALKSVRRILENDPAVSVRRAAVDALARRAASDAQARALLTFVAGHDASDELRARAAGAL